MLLQSTILVGLFALAVTSIQLDINNRDSIHQAAAQVAQGVQDLYQPAHGIIGKWPYPPYYWWESGAAWGGMIEYWHYTGDSKFNAVVHEALTYQLSLSPTGDFNIPGEGFDTGNDDQAFWVIAAMSAAEYGFPQPPPPSPTWLQVAVNAFEVFTQRWAKDSSTCGGGLRWQFLETKDGWNYKNSISNSLFFQISARLARYTGNQTYVDWSHRIWDWTASIGLIDDIYNVFDGSDVLLNCSQLDHHQWSYNVGAFLYGSAALANYTVDKIWEQRTAGLLTATSTFLSPFVNATDVLFEAYCELAGTCNVDQLSMKAYLIRWMVGTSLLAPSTAPRVREILRASAPGAAAACNPACGSKWFVNGSDGTSGLGQQLAVMELFYALLADETTPPPTTSPQVSIQSQPSNIAEILATATSRSRIPTPSASARPLFDGSKSPVASTRASNVLRLCYRNGQPTGEYPAGCLFPSAMSRFPGGGSACISQSAGIATSVDPKMTAKMKSAVSSGEKYAIGWLNLVFVLVFFFLAIWGLID
ncbi:GTP-binding protein 1 [Venturia nashicola]|uniref:mannan endo-1,6-alpha-mannosidase n=1 Tax=Venturia nashicola TaxID=86259 RepID=A0A4Z1NCB6_9PEZI|nr:GTP-binding protein 1 [Venturia nashicola]TLD15081.1 GTP-binding protein 1 [Venturia nashicola]